MKGGVVAYVSYGAESSGCRPRVIVRYINVK